MHLFTESAGTSQNAVLQMPQHSEHSSAARLWQAAEVAAHLHALMGFYCVVLEQIKKQYLLIWGRTKKRSASGTNTTPLSHTLKHSFEFSTLSVFEMAFPEIVIDCLIGCLRVPSNCFSASFQVCVRRE